MEFSLKLMIAIKFIALWTGKCYLFSDVYSIMFLEMLRYSWIFKFLDMRLRRFWSAKLHFIVIRYKDDVDIYREESYTFFCMKFNIDIYFKATFSDYKMLEYFLRLASTYIWLDFGLMSICKWIIFRDIR